MVIKPPSSEEESNLRSMAQDLMSEMITLPANKQIEKSCKSILSSLFTSKAAYYSYKDRVLMKHVTTDLREYEKTGKFGEVESFHRLILTLRSVATARYY